MLDFRKSSINGALSNVLKRRHYPLEVMLTWVRWYAAYPLSLRHIAIDSASAAQTAWRQAGLSVGVSALEITDTNRRQRPQQRR